MAGLRGGLYAAMFVVMYVHAPADIELTAQETVRLDRVAHTDADGATADRHGDLLQPGTNRFRLHEGVYHFRTLHDAQLWVSSSDAVTVLVPDSTSDDPKDPWPPAINGVFDGRGSASGTSAPMLTLSYGQAG